MGADIAVDSLAEDFAEGIKAEGSGRMLDMVGGPIRPRTWTAEATRAQGLIATQAEPKSKSTYADHAQSPDSHRLDPAASLGRRKGAADGAVEARSGLGSRPVKSNRSSTGLFPWSKLAPRTPMLRAEATLAKWCSSPKGRSLDKARRIACAKDFLRERSLDAELRRSEPIERWPFRAKRPSLEQAIAF